MESDRDWSVPEDRAHGDAYAGLEFLGLWDWVITADMVGKTFGAALDATLDRDDAPHRARHRDKK